jgi:hypothetical protein
MAFTEELAPLFADFAAAGCTIGGVAVSAVFSNRANDALFAAGTSPVLTVKSVDVAATARGAAVVVNGTNYIVAKIEHDGTGLARVLLEKA